MTETFYRRLSQSGSSLVVSIPASIVKKYGAKIKDTVRIEEVPGGIRIFLDPNYFGKQDK